MNSAKDLKPDDPHDHTEDEADSAGGWQATEDYLFKHDAAMVKDYADDVDTLLVFAGLFSAVLTAFVVESYQKLEADNEENAVKLLSRIATQMESYTINNGFVNSSNPVIPLPDFSPNTAILYINILWFLSLISSLSAALFGILVKQWLREYLKWNSPLAHPRENILVRQLRYEAWQEWYFTASISLIPALLEGSLILFVSGLATLLWTLDRRVAIVTTTAICLFVVVVVAVTILPVFLKRCPYKSPIAWTLAYAFDFVKDVIGYCANVYASWSTPEMEKPRKALLRWRRKHWRTTTTNWRNRDLASLDISWIKGEDEQTQDVLLTLCEELAKEIVDIKVFVERREEDSHQEAMLTNSKKPCEDAADAATPSTVWEEAKEFDEEYENRKKFYELRLEESDLSTFNEERFDAAYVVLRSAAQLPVLCKALSWVMKASEGTQIQRHVLRCADSMLPPAPTQPSSVVHNISTWYLLCRLFKGGQIVSAGLDAQAQDWNDCTKITKLREHLRSLWYQVGTSHIPRTNGHAYNLSSTLFDLKNPKRRQLRFEDENLYQIITHVIAGNVRASVGEIVNVKEDRWWDSANHLHLRRVTEMLVALTLVLPWSNGGYHLLAGSRALPSCLPVLLDAYNLIARSVCKEDIEWWFPGLRHMVLRVANHFATLDVASDGGLSVIPSGQLPLERHLHLARNLGGLASTGTLEDRQIYVFAISEVLYDLAQHTEGSVYEDVDARIQTLFRESAALALKNGGVYNFTIPKALLNFLHKYQFHPDSAEVPAKTLSLLQHLRNAGLLAGPANYYASVLLDQVTKAESAIVLGHPLVASRRSIVSRYVEDCLGTNRLTIALAEPIWFSMNKPWEGDERNTGPEAADTPSDTVKRQYPLHKTHETPRSQPSKAAPQGRKGCVAHEDHFASAAPETGHRLLIDPTSTQYRRTPDASFADSPEGSACASSSLYQAVPSARDPNSSNDSTSGRTMVAQQVWRAVKDGAADGPWEAATAKG